MDGSSDNVSNRGDNNTPNIPGAETNTAENTPGSDAFFTMTFQYLTVGDESSPAFNLMNTPGVGNSSNMNLDRTSDSINRNSSVSLNNLDPSIGNVAGQDSTGMNSTANDVHSADPRNTNNNGLGDNVVTIAFRNMEPGMSEHNRSVMSIIATMVMRRFVNVLNTPRGIAKEEFEKLPVLKKSDLNGTESICSICYEEYDDEAQEQEQDESSCNSSKRPRSSDSEYHHKSDNTSKRRRHTSQDRDSPIPDHSNVHSPAQTNSESHENDTNEQTTIRNEESTINVDLNADDTDYPNNENNEDINPTYNHTPVKLACGHTFGRQCLFRWSQQQNSCPLCRQKISETTESNMTSQENAGLPRIFFLRRDPIPEPNNNDELEHANSGVLDPSMTRGASNESTTDRNNNNDGNLVNEREAIWRPQPFTMINLSGQFFPQTMIENDLSQNLPNGNESTMSFEIPNNRSINILRSNQPGQDSDTDQRETNNTENSTAQQQNDNTTTEAETENPERRYYSNMRSFFTSFFHSLQRRNGNNEPENNEGNSNPQ